MDEILFRVTLSNEVVGSLVISEPGGWEDAKLKLVRNKEYHSLVELYDQPLTFYGEGLNNNGGLDFIRNIETTQGLDAIITISIEVTHDLGYSYEQLYSGIISLETVKEIDFYKLEAGVLREDFWQKFINRKNTPVDLAADLDLDNQSRVPINPITLPLPDQTLLKRYRAEMYKNWGDGTLDFIVFEFDDATQNRFSGIELPVIVSDTLEDRWPMTNEANPVIDDNTPVFEFFTAKYAGYYTLDVQIALSTSPYYGPSIYGSTTPGVGMRIRKNKEATIALIPTDYGTNGVNGRTVYRKTQTFYLKPGDMLTLYAYIINVSTTCYVIWPNEAAGLQESWIDLSSATIFPDSTTPSFKIKDALESIVSKITGKDNATVSNYLDGCGGNYAIQKGFHIRGFTLEQKPFTMSFDEWWNGVDPILSLGMAAEKIGSPPQDVIRVEPKSYFYDSSSTSVNLDYVNGIERAYDFDMVFKLIEIGYQEWAVESDSGLDDAQTNRVYRTRFKSVGKEVQILSRFIAAALTIEETRRQNDLKKDYRMDEKTFIIALSDSSPDTPELGGAFADVTNVISPETRYNIRLTVARNFERWKSFFSGCLQWYVASPVAQFTFVKGEGNLDMTSTLYSDDCEALGVSPEPTLSEKQNFDVEGDFLFMPVTYSFTHYLTWDQYKAIKENRNKAIGVSRSNTGHTKCFIDELSYEIASGSTSFTVWLAENNPIL
jgi:hypothetical protein